MTHRTTFLGEQADATCSPHSSDWPHPSRPEPFPRQVNSCLRRAGFVSEQGSTTCLVCGPSDTLQLLAEHAARGAERFNASVEQLANRDFEHFHRNADRAVDIFHRNADRASQERIARMRPATRSSA